MAWVLDLDGVVWLADEPIPGAADAVARLRAAGEIVAFVTNNSASRADAVAAKLADMGIPATRDDVVTSAMAAAALVRSGERVLLSAGEGAEEELTRAGAVIVDNRTVLGPGPGEVGNGDRIDVVVVGFHREFDYERMRIACAWVRAGARLIATNDDATYPTPAGPIPGGGSILAGIVTGSGAIPDVAGKPHPAMATLVEARLGSAGVVVGDRPDTDGVFARVLGYQFALVLSGVTTDRDLPVEPRPDSISADLAGVVDEWAVGVSGGDRRSSR